MPPIPRLLWVLSHGTLSRFKSQAEEPAVLPGTVKLLIKQSLIVVIVRRLFPWPAFSSDSCFVLSPFPCSQVFLPGTSGLIFPGAFLCWVYL